MSTTLIEIRRAKASDAADVAGTHDEAWRAAYQGFIPGNELDKLINRRGPEWWCPVCARCWLAYTASDARLLKVYGIAPEES